MATRMVPSNSPTSRGAKVTVTSFGEEGVTRGLVGDTLKTGLLEVIDRVAEKSWLLIVKTASAVSRTTTAPKSIEVGETVNCARNSAVNPPTQRRRSNKGSLLIAVSSYNVASPCY